MAFHQILASEKLLDRVATRLDPRQSLRARLGLTICSIALVMAVIASITVSATASDRVKTNAGIALEQLAYQVSDKLDRGMFERYREIQNLTELDLLSNPNSPRSQKRSLLDRLQSTYPTYSWIGLTDATGQVLVSTGKLLENLSVAQRPWFQNARTQAAVGDVHEAMLLAKLLPNPANEPLRFIDISAPVTDSAGKLTGVLGAHLSWTWAKEIRDSLLQPLQNRSQVEVFIFSASGKVLLAPIELQDRIPSLPNLQTLQQQGNGYALETWSDGDLYLTGFARSTGYRNYPGLGWTIIVRQQADLALAPVRALQRQIFTQDLTLGILFAIAGWFVMRRLTYPLLAIATAADRLRQGETNTDLPLITSSDEIGRLSRSLKHLVCALFEQQQQLNLSNEQLQIQLTERQRTAAEIQQLNATLEQKVSDRTAQLQEINRELEAFAYSASHDLRAPLRTIRGFAQALQEDYSDRLDDLGREYIQSITADAVQMDRLIAELLAYSQLTRTKITLQPVALMTTIASARKQLETDLQEKQAEITVTTPLPTVLAHSQTLTQAIANLLSNALKFIKPESHPQVEIKYQLIRYHQQQWARLWIIDNGIGIASSDTERIFRIFERLHGIESYPGTGIGLAIVRKSIERMGGCVGVESQLGQGSRFWIELPLYEG
ncbi:MAG: Adaptive-response sensory-kinase SasA [Chroococcidiopsis sp. SAG 2025]|uniref:ATP-binding protein n=1 Tax=Chroococcidiopsis sp. SAG 2025 TaxID=171389 RepID=UPI002936D750|nr:ATP-binding protein [Chroococcidiopsis sp. SAG 2025]MDV2995330.1 Adaptive-response sensory-kinase SasA [Chroococcidiopsis sp. SAG 2025]